MIICPALAGLFLVYCVSKKSSPVGVSGSRRLTDEESYLSGLNTSSTANAVPLPHWRRLFNFTANFADARMGLFFENNFLFFSERY